MKTDQTEDPVGLSLPTACRYACALLAAMLVVSGCATSKPAPTHALTREQAYWVSTLNRWYPGWENADLQDPAVTLTPEQRAWAERLQQWYPDWEPAAPITVRPSARELPRPHTQPGGQPINQAELPRMVPVERSRAPAADSPAALDAARGVAPPVPVAPAATRRPANNSSTVPADRDDFRIVPEDAASPDRSTERYTIQRGDTLSKIAEKFYGDASAWRRIRDANPLLISNPNNLTTGVTIRIP